MTFKDKLRINREVYYIAKKDNKALNKEVATRNNTKSIIVTRYDIKNLKDKPNKN